MRLAIVLLLTIGSSLMQLACPAVAQDQNIGPLPSEVTAEALRKLSIDGWSKASSAPINLKVDLGKISDAQKTTAKINPDGTASVPFIVPNVMSVQFAGHVELKDMQAFLAEKNARVISVQKEIGTVQIETNLSKYFEFELKDKSVNEMYLRGLVAAIDDFKNDPRIGSAAPDTVLSNKAITNLAKASNIHARAGTSESTDWGVIDIEADKLWTLPGAAGGVIFGVMDVGFAPHEDIVFSGLGKGVVIEDHGNHVAGDCLRRT